MTEPQRTKLSLAYYYAGSACFWLCHYLRIPGTAKAYHRLMILSIRNDPRGKVWVPK